MAHETSKCLEKRLKSGDFDKYLRGKGIDIGCGDDLLKAPHASVDPWDQSQGSAEFLESVASDTYDFVYSSHCLEHLESVDRALSNWVRVLKPAGYLYLVVPDYVLYEKMQFPSMFASEHKHSFSMTLSRQRIGRDTHWHIKADLLPALSRLGVDEIKTFLEDDYFDYNVGPGPDQTMWPNTLAQICVIGQKKR